MRLNLALKVAGWGLTLTSAAVLAFTQNRPAHAEPARAAAQLEPLRGSPVRFEANRGQLAHDVAFLARGQGYGLYLSSDVATLRLLRASGEPASLSLRVVGARAVEPRGLEQLPGSSNYFVGAERARWKTGVESYARVRYEQVLPGVSLVYYGTDGKELEYDLELAAGVEPGGIQLAFEGASALRMEPDGAVTFQLVGGGEVRQSAPVAYQLGERGERQGVTARYQQRGDASLGIVVGAYDPTRPLVIDPTVVYSTFLGGEGLEDTYGVAIDVLGNVYVVGQTTSTIFSTQAPYQVHLSGFSDAFVSKLNPLGTALVYSTYLGGSGSEFGYSVAADLQGNAYVAGLTNSTDFPMAAALQPTNGGSQDGFVTKLTSTGLALTYSTYFGGSGDDFIAGLALDASNNVLLAGTTSSPNFASVGAFQQVRPGGNDAFVAKLNAAGSALLYRSYLGGTGNDAGTGIRVSSAGEAFVTGATASLDFLLAAPRQGASGGGFDAFVTRVNAAGSALIYSTYLGGSGADRGAALALDASGNAYVTGNTTSTNFPTASPYQAASGGGTDAFLSKLSADGATFAYSTYLGGSGADSGLGVSLDPARTALVVGSTASTNFPLFAPTQNAHGGGTTDGFIFALTPAGGATNYSTYLGGSGQDKAVAVSSDGLGSAVVVGNTQSSNFPLASAFRPTFSGSQEAFITKLTFNTPAPASPGWSLALLGGLLVGLGLVFGSRFVPSDRREG